MEEGMKAEQDDNYQLSKYNAKAYQECQNRLEKLRNSLDDKAKDFYTLALRENYD